MTISWTGPNSRTFADDNPNVAKIMIFIFDRVENTVGEGESVGYQHFLLFPQCFQKASFSGSLKVWTVWSRVNCAMYNLTLSQASPGFTCLQYKPFENTVGKGENCS